MKKWKKIPNYNLYEASSEGEIKTFNWKGSGSERIMKPAMDNGGYLRTMLKRDDGIIHTIKVHRIIAKTFILNPFNKPEVNHKNSIRSDNRIINLEWVNHRENVKHSFTNKMQNNLGENNPCASLTDVEVIEIRENYIYNRKSRFEKGLTKKEIAGKYKTTIPVIKRIIQGKTWKHLL